MKMCENARIPKLITHRTSHRLETRRMCHGVYPHCSLEWKHPYSEIKAVLQTLYGDGAGLWKCNSSCCLVNLAVAFNGKKPNENVDPIQLFKMLWMNNEHDGTRNSQSIQHLQLKIIRKPVLGAYSTGLQIFIIFV